MSRHQPVAARSAVCPCDSGKPYAACCEPIHHRSVKAPTAEALMRSRYSAYVLGNEAWLLASWHVSTRPARVLDDDHASVRWLGLSVKAHVVTGENTATVEFIARSKRGGEPAHRLHERSRFVREPEDAGWYYLDGEFITR